MLATSILGRVAALLLTARLSATVAAAVTCSSSSSSSNATTNATTACATCATYRNSTSTPVVDLLYALYAGRATLSPDSRTYYNFSNIRYAAPPVGARRFQKPADPPANRTAGVQDGAAYGKICPQAYTPWQSRTLVTAPPGEHESEDCLFLDVIVPADAWDQRCGGGAGARRPVLVWIHGGGFQIGAKYGTPDSNPLGLLDRSFEDDGEGVIWVGLNYRVSWRPPRGGFKVSH
jgi:hypothetical protein